MAGNSKNILKSFACVSAGDMSGNITGTPVNIQYLDNVAIQCVFTGSSPTGTLKIMGSTTHDSNPLTAQQSVAGTFSDTGISAAISASGDVLFNLAGLAFTWIRLDYARTSGTGTLTATLSAKAI